MNMVYVASRFEISRRRENLSWSHHEAVVSLDPDEQDHWLDQAIEHRMSVADLRLAQRSRQRGYETPSSREATDRAEDNHASLTCPNCGHSIPSSVFIAKM